MPKEYAHCTCHTCGKPFTKVLYESGKGATKRLAEKVEWAENGGISECPDCFKARKRAEEKSAGLTCDIRLGSVMDREPTVYAVFGGDSYSHKDELKAAGCRFTEEYPEGKALADMLSLTTPRPAWVLYGSDPNELAEKAKALGATVTWPSPDEIRLWGTMRSDVVRMREAEVQKVMEREQQKRQEIQAKLDALGPIPTWPDSIKAKWPEGAKWNGKVYGRKPGTYCIYLSGEKVPLTDGEKDEIERVRAARETWRAEKKRIGG